MKMKLLVSLLALSANLWGAAPKREKPDDHVRIITQKNGGFIAFKTSDPFFRARQASKYSMVTYEKLEPLFKNLPKFRTQTYLVRPVLTHDEEVIKSTLKNALIRALEDAWKEPSKKPKVCRKLSFGKRSSRSSDDDDEQLESTQELDQG